MLSGLSRSMPELIAMRVLQGIGAGAVAPIILTLLSDLYTLEERAKVQGLFSGVWGVAGLGGPALGGVLTVHLSWRWVFFVSVPFAVVAFWVLARHVHEHVEEREVQPIDWSGAALLACGSSLLLLSVLGGADRGRFIEAGLIGLAVTLLVAFISQELRAADPILPPDLMTRPTIAAAIVGNFLIGGLMLAIDMFIPLYIQGVRGGSAEQAGAIITPLFVAWSISVTIAAQIVVRLGFRRTCLLGSAIIALGSLALIAGASQPERCIPAFFAGMVLIGLGMGPTALSFLLSVQNSVPWNRRGVATGAVAFFRMIGGALGVGVLGAVQGFSLARRLAATRGIDLNAALRPETHYLLSRGQLETVQAALGASLWDVFLLMFIVTLLSLTCSLWLPAGRAVSRVGRTETEDWDDLPRAMPAAVEV